MFANFVHGDAAFLCRVSTHLKSRVDLFAKTLFSPSDNGSRNFKRKPILVAYSLANLTLL